MQKKSSSSKVVTFASIVARIVLTFVLIEVLLLPLHTQILIVYAAFIATLGIHNVAMAWECTAIDETLLAVIAILLWKRNRCTYIAAVLSALAVQVFNISRIAVLSIYPSPLLHAVLFRLGGFLVILGTVYVSMRICGSKNKKGVIHR